MTDKFFLKNKSYFLRDSNSEDNEFIYNLVGEFLKTDLSVTFLSLPPLNEFFKNKIKKIKNFSNFEPKIV